MSLAVVVWLGFDLRRCVEFLEHEVRWLRSELESLKPREVRSLYD
ncbi:MAG: hypothetical protein ACR2OV_17550 [Hyphomicrobiaceae bacterium]